MKKRWNGVINGIHCFRGRAAPRRLRNAVIRAGIYRRGTHKEQRFIRFTRSLSLSLSLSRLTRGCTATTRGNRGDHGDDEMVALAI